jgi:response regulator RpfG family c-di-GMP phosphodiesterase
MACHAGFNLNSVYMLQNYRLYIIDDDADDLEFLAAGIAQQAPAIETVCFRDPEEGLRNLMSLLPSELPHLVIVDHNMPKLYGIELIKTLRSADQFDRTGIVLYTTDARQFSGAPEHAFSFVAINKAATMKQLNITVERMLDYLRENTES